MRIGIPRERLTNETRVAATPKTVEQLLKLGFTVAVESGAETAGQGGLSPDIHFNAAIHMLIIHGKLQRLCGEIVTVHLIQRDRQRIHSLQPFDGRWCQSVVIFQIRANVTALTAR